METVTVEHLLSRIEELENSLAESEQLIEAIKSGQVDAFAINNEGQQEIYTLKSGDYTYRILVEHFNEGALNLTEEGLIVYTNTYFHELLGLNYEKVIGKSVFNFIHPDSRDKFTALFSKGLAGQGKGEINLQAGKKTIPAYISLTSLYPQLPTVGMIVSDMTEKKKDEEVILQYQKDLEAKNLELLRNNAELTSFSYIASHDLKEPLRKIQMFVDRIMEMESEKFSPTTKDYFQRINSATIRMQNLMSGLLSYSRANVPELAFIPTDLNLLVEEVKNNLNELISDTKAVIETLPLPALKVIPLQITQVFSNLIINSLKYRNPEAKPVIKISADLAPVDEIPEEVAFEKNKYWKITVQDNGIGFEEQYADKIFEPFQRLHSNDKYEGTGIGLAICKKIIQNHRGFIKAEGRPGSGAAFRIYIPIQGGQEV